jgi:hypothetical protein
VRELILRISTDSDAAEGILTPRALRRSHSAKLSFRQRHFLPLWLRCMSQLLVPAELPRLSVIRRQRSPYAIVKCAFERAIAVGLELL